ncbi:MAG: acyltransferase [Pseudonocardia sp.]
MSDGYRRLTLAAGASPGRLRQLDALRVLTCLSVVLVHSIGAYSPDLPGPGAATALLHYSREIFFFVSALVLVRTYVPRLGPDGKLADEAGFRRRRMRLIGIPYLLWTALYLLVWVWHVRATEPMLRVLDELPMRFWYLVVTGNGSYHMYFLLVTLQFAVIFPAVLALLTRTQGRHGRVLAVATVIQAATLAAYHWVQVPDEGWRMLLGDSSLFAYQLWLVAGALAGLHLERMHDWITGHRALVLASVPVTGALLLWAYWVQVPSRGAMVAGTPLQPVMVLWSASMLGALYLVADRLARLRGALARSVFDYGAQLSFGVYLAHPLLLDLIQSAARRVGLFAASPAFVLASFVLTAGGSVALCALLHRTRLSLPLMGRARHRRPAPAREVASQHPRESSSEAAPKCPRESSSEAALKYPRESSGEAALKHPRQPEQETGRSRVAATTALMLVVSIGMVLGIGSSQSPSVARASWAVTVQADGNVGVDPAGR